MELLIDLEFKNLIPPLTSEEFKQLELNCIKDGIRDAITTWNGFIIDGHNRYEIANKHGLSYVTKELLFESKNDVKLWIIENQIGRRNITNFVRIELMQEYKAVLNEIGKIKQTVYYGNQYQKLENNSGLLSTMDKSAKLFKEHEATIPINNNEPINTRNIVADKLNLGSGTIARAETIIKKAPEDVKDKVRSGEISINQAYKEIKIAEKIEARKEMIENVKIQIENENMILTDKYDVLVIDPPWDYGREYNPETSRVSNPYPEMSVQQIKNIELPIKDNAVIFLWTTHAYLKHSFDILDNWGLTYKATMVWDKDMMGMGATIRMQCEFCIIAIKGKPILNGSSERDIIREKRREHSRKPDGFYEFVERFTIGKKLDYFSRSKREGWDTYGAETNKF